MPPLLIDGPDDAKCTVLLAHGAGAGMEHVGMVMLAQALAEYGARIRDG